MWLKKRYDKKSKRQYAEIQRPDTKGTSSIEIEKVILRIFCLQQYSSDEKAGKHEEQIDSRPSITKNRDKMKRRHVSTTVINHHHKHCNATQYIELFHVVR